MSEKERAATGMKIRSCRPHNGRSSRFIRLGRFGRTAAAAPDGGTTRALSLRSVTVLSADRTEQLPPPPQPKLLQNIIDRMGLGRHGGRSSTQKKSPRS